jgi:branched-chain amino acid transport system substrate-binding protein
MAIDLNPWGRRLRSPLMAAGGMVLALSGCGDNRPVAVGVTLGGSEADAALFAYEDARSAGLRIAIDTVFVREADTHAAPTIQTVERMIAVPGILAVVGNGNSAASLAAAPLYNSNKVVQLSPHSTAVLYSGAGPYSYRLVSPDDRQGRFLGAQLLAEARGRRVALVYVNDDYGRGLRREVLRAVGPSGVVWALDAPFVEGGDSIAMTRMVRSLVETRAEMILWIGRDLDLNLALPGIRKVFGAISILCSDGVGHARELRHPDDRWNGVRFVELVDLDAGAAIRAFRARYLARWRREPSGPEVLTYDAMTLLIAAVEAGARNGTDVQRYLDGLGTRRPAFAGVAGPVRFDAQGDVERTYTFATMPSR